MSFRNGEDPDIRLSTASSIHAELTWDLRWRSLSAYGGATHVRTRVSHSSAMVLQGLDEQRMSNSQVNLTTPTIGVFWTPQPSWLFVHPTIRVGGGVKFYDFQLREIPNGVQDPTAEIGFGIIRTEGSMSFMAEARWMPSKFDPAFLPVPVITGDPQLQNDWVAQIGFRFRR
jgi:hypothetical protein